MIIPIKFVVVHISCFPIFFTNDIKTEICTHVTHMFNVLGNESKY